MKPDPKVRKILERHKRLKTEKDPWLNTWQILSQFVRTLKQTFSTEPAQGQFLTGKIFDGTAPKANNKMASSMQAMLFPSAKNSFRIGPPDDADDSLRTKEVKDWYEYVTTVIQQTCDNEAGGLTTSLSEVFNDLGAFGTCGISVLENYDQEDGNAVDVKFGVVDVKTACIDVGADKRIDTVYIETRKTVRQLVHEYGVEKVSKKTREMWEKQKFDEKVTCLHAVEPRLDRVVGGLSNLDMPFASVHIEVESQHILAESGFTELPFKISRFMVAPNEIYGRGPAQEALPDIIEVNALRESTIGATEKILDPPLAMLDDGAAGGGVLDTSAGALNVRMLDGFMRDSNRPLVEQIFTIQELRTAKERILELQDNIDEFFYLPEFLGIMEITKRMTLGEADMQNDIRMQSLTGIFARQQMELTLPVVERTMRIQLGRGRLGVIEGSEEDVAMRVDGIEPKYIPMAVVARMLQGKNFAKVIFICPAARIMRNDELTGIQKTLGYAASIAEVVPDVMDNFDVDRAMHIVQDLYGASSEIMRSKDEIDQIREQRAQMQAQAQELQMQQVQADIAKSQTQAMHSAAKAQKESVA